MTTAGGVSNGQILEKPASENPTSQYSDQNCGELFPFIEALKPHLPADYGTMPVRQVLKVLQKSARDTFSKLENYIEKMKVFEELNDDIANTWKSKGNDAYQRSSFRESIHCYSRALICAASDDMVAALLNNRSAAFFMLKYYEFSCIDANACLKLKEDYWKALERRGAALKELGLVELGNQDIHAASEKNFSLGVSVTEIEDRLQSMLGLLKGTSVPPKGKIAACAKLATSSKGRKIVALEDISSGTILEETPYASVTKSEKLLFTCSFCLQHTVVLFPGTLYRKYKKNARGLFCCDECASDAWEYYGLSETNSSFFLCCPNDALLAHRLLQSLERFHNLGSYDIQSHFYGTEEHQPPSEYVKRMESDFSKELSTFSAVGGNETIVSAIGLFWGTFTEEYADLHRKAQRQILINGIDVKYSIQLPVIADPQVTLPSVSFRERMETVGCGVYALASLFNHSCDPNCFLSFEGNPQGCSAKIAVRVIRPICAGEEFTVAYGGLTRYVSHSKSRRSELLRLQYGFSCRCSACINDSDRVTTSEELEHYTKAADYYQKGCRLIREKNYETAVTVLLQSYEIVMRYICFPPRPPQTMIPLTHTSLAMAYYHLNNRSKCLEHLKAALSTDIEIHGTDIRPEMIQVYNRLSTLETNEQEKNTFCEKAITLLETFYLPSKKLGNAIALVYSDARL